MQYHMSLLTKPLKIPPDNKEKHLLELLIVILRLKTDALDTGTYS